MLNEACPYIEDRCRFLGTGCDCAKYLAYVDASDPEKVKKILADNNFDLNLPTWELLMSMQMSFAQRQHPVEGLTKADVDHWVDAYLVCIDDEVREVREYLNIYGQGASHDNVAELKKEVVDIIHFVMDLFIVGNCSPEQLKSAYCARYGVTVNDGDDLFNVAYNKQAAGVLDYLGASGITKDMTVLKATCKLLDAGAAVRQLISWKHWKRPSDTIDFDKLHDAYAGVFYEFVNLYVLTMANGELRDIYVRKNAENIFRQIYGY